MDIVLTRTVSPMYFSGEGLPLLYFRFRGSAATQLTAYRDRRSEPESVANVLHSGHTVSMRHSSGASIQMRIQYDAIHRSERLPLLSNVTFVPYEDRGPPPNRRLARIHPGENN